MPGLKLDVAANAVTRREHGRTIVELPDYAWLRVEIDPPSLPPDDASEWFRAVLKRDAAGVVRVLGSIRGRSPRGWPLEIVSVVEASRYRLIALYEMTGHVAAVSASTSERELYVGAFQQLLLPLVASAMPIWRTREPVALVELWSLAVSPPDD